MNRSRAFPTLQRWACVHEYLGYGSKLNMHITSDVLLDLAGRKIFTCGKQYFESGCVTDLYAVEEELHATVRGTEVYPVRLWIEDDELYYQSGCPMGKRALCCKHVIAAGLAWEVEM